jgi:hypothetical protein
MPTDGQDKANNPSRFRNFANASKNFYILLSLSLSHTHARARAHAHAHTLHTHTQNVFVCVDLTTSIGYFPIGL